jgi:uncharacterized delta-60 repeat protein
MHRAIRPVAQALESRVLLSAVSWVGAASGIWDNAANWSNSVVPTATDDITINVAAITVTCNGTDAAHSITSNNDLIMAAGSLSVTTTLTLLGGSSCQLNGGELIGASVTGPLIPNGSGSSDDLQNVTLNSNQTVPFNQTLRFHGLTLNNANITEAGALIAEAGGDLLGTGTITFSGGAPFFTIGSGAVTVGPNIVFNGADALIATNSGSTLTLQGTIQADVPTASSGWIISGPNVTNTGTLQAINGGKMVLETDVGSAGVIKEINSELDVATNIASVTNFSSVGGVVNLEDTLDLAAGTQTTAATLTLDGGTITNGTLGFSGGAQLIASATGGTLDHVTLNSNATIPDGATLTIQNGLVLNNASITLTGTSATTLAFTGAVQTLSGTGQIIFAGTTPALDQVQTGSPLTIGSGITIIGPAGSITAISGAPVQLLGTVVATTFGQAINLNGDTITTDGELDATPGMIFFNGNYSPPAVGTVKIGIDSSGAGLFQVNGCATLAGTLAVSLLGGFIPTQGSTFTLVKYPAATGSFGTVLGLSQAGVVFSQASTANNITLTTVSAPPPAGSTDLTISSINDTHGTYFPGNVLVASVAENAAGPGPAGPFSVAMVLSQDTIFGDSDDIPLQTVQSPGFTGAGNATANFQATIPSNAPAGSYHLIADINSTNSVAETSSANNLFVTPATDIAIAPAPVVPIPSKVGKLDPNFGNNGLASHSVGLINTTGVALQSDGKSVIIGTAGSLANGDFGLTRYNTDGSVDTTFGNGGVVNTDFAGGNDQPSAVSILPSGKILVIGTSANALGTSSQFALAQYNADGSPDTTFGNGTGQELVSFSSDPVNSPSLDIARSVAIGSNGVFYVAGSSNAGSSHTQFAIAGFNPDGSLPTSFNGTGKELTTFAGGADSINAITLQGSSLVAVGSSQNPSTGVTSIAVAEYLASGALNSKFGSGGKVTTSLRGVDDEATSVAIGPKGVIVVGGLSATGSAAGGSLSCDFALVRYTSDGKPDKTFGQAGHVITSFGQPSAITQILVAADGTITASGKTVSSLSSVVTNQLEIAIAHYTAKGALDRTFNGTGELVIDLGAVQPSVLRSTTASPGILFRPADLFSQFKDFTQSAQGVLATTQGGQILTAGTQGTATVVAVVVTSGVDLSASIVGKEPSSVIGGGKGTASVVVTNTGTNLASGTVTVSLFASPGPTPQVGDALIKSQPQAVKLLTNKNKAIKFSFVFPGSVIDGNYFLVAQVTSGGIQDINASNNIAASSSAVRIAKPFVDLSGHLGSIPGSFPAGKKTIINVTVTNSGNELAKSSTVQFLASADKTLATGTVIGSAPLALNLKAGASKSFKESFVFPSSLPAGTYFLLALLDPSNILKDPNFSNNLLVSGTSFVVA